MKLNDNDRTALLVVALVTLLISIALIVLNLGSTKQATGLKSDFSPKSGKYITEKAAFATGSKNGLFLACENSHM